MNNTHDPVMNDHPNVIYRLLWSLRELGLAYQKGILLVNEDAPPGLKTEVKIILDEAQKFAEQA